MCFSGLFSNMTTSVLKDGTMPMGLLWLRYMVKRRCYHHRVKKKIADKTLIHYVSVVWRKLVPETPQDRLNVEKLGLGGRLQGLGQKTSGDGGIVTTGGERGSTNI